MALALFGAGDETVDAGEEVIGEQGLESEVNIEAGVLIFGFGEAADDEDGDGRGELAYFADELGAVHAGHDVVGEDEVDGCGELVAAELLEGAFGVQDGDYEVTSSLEDGLTGCCLDSVVVDKQDCCGHAFLTGLNRSWRTSWRSCFRASLSFAVENCDATFRIKAA